MRNVKTLTFLFLGIALAAGVAAASVTDDVRSVVDEVVRVVSDKEMKKPQNEAKCRKAIKSLIGRIFDFQEMTKRSLATNWNTLSAAQQKEVTDLFAILLEHSYASKIQSYNNEKIVYVRESVDGDYAEVKSKVVTPKRDEFTLDYRLMKKGGKWVVYDVVIEGVSLVSNYRGQFGRIISAEGYPALMKKLKNRVDEMKL